MRLNALDWLNFSSPMCVAARRLCKRLPAYKGKWSQGRDRRRAGEQWPHRHHGASGGRRLYRPHTGKAGPDHRRGIRPVGCGGRDRVDPSFPSCLSRTSSWLSSVVCCANRRRDNPRPVWTRGRCRYVLAATPHSTAPAMSSSQPHRGRWGSVLAKGATFISRPYLRR